MRIVIPALAALALLPLASTTPAAAQDDSTVHMVSYIDAAPLAAARNQATALLRQLANASRQDAGLIRFEILQRTSPSSQFAILESWKDQAAFDAHVAAAHNKRFRGAIRTHLIAPIDDRLSLPTLIDPARPVSRKGVVYVVTHVDVPPGVREKGQAALTALAEASRKESGNLRFDVMAQKNRLNHFTVVEIWRDQRTNDAHERAPHTREFRNVLTPITGALYDQRWYRAL